MSLAARRGLLDEATVRRTLAGRAPTADALMALPLNCARCGRRVTTDGSALACPSCGIRVSLAPGESSAPLPADAADAARDPANAFGRFIRLRELGRGGFGAVFLAWDPALSRPAALKLLKGDDPEDLARFKREAQLAAGLSHPNIAAVFEVGESRGQTYLAMQFIDGETAAAREHDLPRACAIVRDAARAVHHAHTQGIIHRDLKPENLMLNVAGRVFVMDFGLAKRQAADSSISQSGAVMGTPAYMPPEQAEGHVHLDARADVYSLGATLYRMATGLPPYPGNAAQVLKEVLTADPIAPRRLKPSIPRDVEVIIQKAMAREPARRYASAAELADDLERYLKGEAISARPASWTYRTRKRVARNPWAWGLGAAAVLALVVGLGVVAWVAAAGGRKQHALELVHQAAVAYGRDDLAETERLVREALALDASNADADYWLARLKLREYQALRGVPEARIVSGMVEVLPARPETAEEAALRHEIEEAFARVPGQALSPAIVALWEGRAADALRELEGRDESWEESLYRAQAKYFLCDFDGAARDVESTVGTYVREAGPVAARIWLARGLWGSLCGEDPGQDWFPRAQSTAVRVQRAGKEREGRVLEGAVLVAWGEWAQQVGESAEQMERDSRRYLEGAVELVREVEGVDARLVEGDALLALARLEASRGEREPARFDAAIEAYGRAVEADAGHGPARVRRGAAWEARCEFLMNFGRGESEDLRRAKEEYAQALSINDTYADAVIGRARVEGRSERWGLDEVEPVLASYEREITALGQVATKRPDYPPAHSAMGTARDDVGLYRYYRGRDPTADYEAAIDDFTRAVSINPTFAEAFEKRGLARQNLGAYRHECGQDPTGDYEAAIEDFARAVEINPSFAEAFKSRGLARQNLGFYRASHGQDPTADYDAAIDDFTRAVSINPSFAEGLEKRGVARQNQGAYREDRSQDPTSDYEAAIEDSTRAVWINPLSAEAFKSRGDARQKLGLYRAGRGQDATADYEAAIEDYTRAIEINPLLAEAFMGRGVARQDLGLNRAGRGQDATADYEAAIEDYTRAVLINPSLEGAFKNRGVAHQNLAYHRRTRGQDATADYEAAVVDFTRAVGINPSSAEAFMSRGLAHLNLGLYRRSRGQDATADCEAAIEDYRQSLELNDRNLDAWMYLGLAQRNLAQARGGDRALLEESAASLSRAIDLDPGSAEARRYRGKTLLTLGRAAEAAADFEEALRLNPALAGEITPLLERARREAASPEY